MTKNEDHKIRNALNSLVADFSAHAFVRSKIKFQQPVKEFEELVKACRKCKGNDPTVWFRF